MSVFWQHVGIANSQRDFPLTLGTPSTGVQEFRVVDVEPYVLSTNTIERLELERGFERIRSSTFQIWGFPNGAEAVLSKMKTGDFLLLLDTNAEAGAFRYFGRVLQILLSKQWDLSQKLWNKNKYPIITFMAGRQIHYPWQIFLNDFGYGLGLKPMGRTYRVANEVLAASKYRTDHEFYDQIIEEYGT
jgi:hypothetical protein